MVRAKHSLPFTGGAGLAFSFGTSASTVGEKLLSMQISWQFWVKYNKRSAEKENHNWDAQKKHNFSIARLVSDIQFIKTGMFVH